jgi:HEAT repeat protein
MESNGRKPEVRVALPRSRFRSTWPLLLVAGLFVVGAFSTWYFTWFGRELNDQDISTYLADEQHPRKAQHALVQIQQRIDRHDPAVKQWYPQLVKLADSRETELRLTLAWLMGADSNSKEFHETLLKLLKDLEPIVRRNAALALVRFGDASGRGELRTVFEPYELKSPSEGTLSSTLRAGAKVSRGTLLARIQEGNAIAEVRSPLPATVDNLVMQSGARVNLGDLLLTLRSDEESVWEALRGLALIGSADDIPLIEQYVKASSLSERNKEQAALTVKAIQGRANSEKQTAN